MTTNITLNGKTVIIDDDSNIKITQDSITVGAKKLSITGDKPNTVIIKGTVGNIETDLNVVVDGSVEGNIDARANVNCGNVEGDINVHGNINCEDVEGDINAGGNVVSGDIEGDCRASGNIVSK